MTYGKPELAASLSCCCRKVDSVTCTATAITDARKCETAVAAAAFALNTEEKLHVAESHGETNNTLCGEAFK